MRFALICSEPRICENFWLRDQLVRRTSLLSRTVPFATYSPVSERGICAWPHCGEPVFWDLDIALHLLVLRHYRSTSNYGYRNPKDNRSVILLYFWNRIATTQTKFPQIYNPELCHHFPLLHFPFFKTLIQAFPPSKSHVSFREPQAERDAPHSNIPRNLVDTKKINKA